jgi:putative hydrolase of the HAD superfamily
MKIVLIGSFRKDFKEIKEFSLLFKNAGFQVLSPRLGEIINSDAEFITLSTDKHGDAKSIQDEVFEKIKESDFIYLVNPRGEVGLSATLELGYCASLNKTVYALKKPSDATLQHYVKAIITVEELIQRANLTGSFTVEPFHLFFDADDTLWDDQGKLQKVEKEIEEMLDGLLGKETNFQAKFIETEHRNIPKIGFGFHSYLFSMAEIYFRELEYHEFKHEFIERINSLITSYIHDVPSLFTTVLDTLQELRSRGYKLHIITRGIRQEQMEKIRKASLIDLFDTIHVVDKKNVDTYKQIMSGVSAVSEKSCMIGNSIKSDIKPALEAGMLAVFIPTINQWEYDKEIADKMGEKMTQAKAFSDLLQLFLNPYAN